MQARSETTIRNIQDALRRLMVSRPLSEITVNDICREAGASVGAFYHHFKSRDELFMSIIRGTHGTLSERLRPRLTEDAVSNVRQYVFMVAEKYTGIESSFVKELYIAHIRMGQDFSLLHASPNFILLCDILRDGQARGQIRSDLAAEKLAEQIVMLCEGWQYTWCVNAGSYSLTAYIAEHIDALLAMLRPNKA